MRKLLCILMSSVYILSTLPSMMLDVNANNSELISITEVDESYYQQKISVYEEMEEFVDPQVDGYTDEDFFGVYDGSKWTRPSLLNYKDFSGLALVEEAAKNGDYSSAKYELLHYYKEKYRNSDLTAGNNITNEILNKSLLLLENAYAGADIAGFIKVTRDLKSYKVNVRQALSDSMKNSSGKFGLVFAGIRKDGTSAIIYSKESDYIPVLSVTVNGRLQEYTPIADTYVSAEENQYNNYGNESILLASESYSSIGHPKRDKIDSFTKRGYMLFDLSDIHPEDTIDNAVLMVYGNLVDSDCPEQPECIPDYSDIVVLTTTVTSQGEDELTWASLNDGYISSYGDSCVAVETPLRLSRFNPLLQAYNATKIDAFGYAATRQILWNVYNFFTNQFDYSTHNTLNNSQFVADFPWQFGDLVNLPEHIITPEMFTFILKFVHATAEHAVNNWTSSEEGGNWGNVNANGVAIAGMVYPEFAVVDDELIPSTSSSLPGRATGGWKAVGDFRMDYTARSSILEDGSFSDTSYGYAAYIINQYNRFFRVANALGVNINTVLSKSTLELFSKYLLFMLNLSNPLGGGWGQGDCDEASYHRNVLLAYRNVIEAMDNPQLNWFIGNEVENGKPDFLSFAYDYGRKATLRSDWSKQALAAFINADGSVFAHAHNDDLGLNVYAYGSLLLADPISPGTYDTGQPVTNLLYSTRGHNTIEINGVNARGPGTNMTLTNAEGEEETIIVGSGGAPLGSLHPENREFNKLYNFIQAESFGYQNNSSVDENFSQFREVLMISPEYLIVTDRITPDGADGDDDDNTYSQFWHSVPDANITVDSENGVAQSHFDYGANITIASVKDSVPVNTSKHFSWYVTENQFADYVRYDKKAPGAITFNTVLYPTSEGNDVELSTQSLSTDLAEHEASAFNFTVHENKTGAEKKVTYYNLHDFTKKSLRTVGEYETDASLSLVQTLNGKYDKAIIRSGTLVGEKNGVSIIKSNSHISELGVQWMGDEISLVSSKFFVDKSYVDVGHENLSIGRRGTSSLHYNNSNVEYAFDGDLNTSWSSVNIDGEEEQPWLALNLENAQEISKVIVKDNDPSIKYTLFYLTENEEWAEIKISNEYKDPLADSERPVKTYCFEPIETRYIKIQADTLSDIQIFEMEVYSGLANAISLYDLSIYAPGGIRSVSVNGKSVPVYKNGDYLVFSEELAGDTPSIEQGGNSNSSNDKIHGNGPSPGGGGGGSSNKEDTDTESETPVVTPDVKYSDIETHWAKQEIAFLSEKGIISGYEDGGFKPDNHITRAEFLALATRLIDSEEKADIDFNDVTAEDWYYDVVRKGVALGIISTDTSYRPNDLISREEMCKIISIVCDIMKIIDEDTMSINFKDKDAISPWAESYVAKMIASGIIKGNDRGEFLPKGRTTRAEAATVIYRILNADAE